MTRHDDMRMYYLLQRLFQGNIPTEQQIEYVLNLLKQIETIDYSSISIDKISNYTEIAGKCYIFCLAYVKMYRGKK